MGSLIPSTLSEYTTHELTTAIMDLRESTHKSDDILDLVNHTVATRASLAGLTLLEPITHTVDGVIGLSLGCVSIITSCITYRNFAFRVNDLSDDFCYSGENVLSHTFFTFIKVIYPEAQGFVDEDPLCIDNNDGFLTNIVKAKDKKSPLSQAQTYAWSNNPLERHVFSRLAYALTGIICIITRIADAIFAVIFTPLALLCLGRSDKLNEYAYASLQFTGIVNDIIQCARKTIYPFDEDQPDVTDTSDPVFPMATGRRHTVLQAPAAETPRRFGSPRRGSARYLSGASTPRGRAGTGPSTLAQPPHPQRSPRSNSVGSPRPPAPEASAASPSGDHEGRKRAQVIGSTPGRERPGTPKDDDLRRKALSGRKSQTGQAAASSPRAGKPATEGEDDSDSSDEEGEVSESLVTSPRQPARTPPPGMKKLDLKNAVGPDGQPISEGSKDSLDRQARQTLQPKAGNASKDAAKTDGTCALL